MKNEYMKDHGEIVIPVSGEEESTSESEELQGVKDGQITEADQMRERIQRLQAEFTNFKRRVEKEREKDFQTAKGNLIFKLLPVLDDLDRMVQHHSENDECSPEGVRLIFQKMQKIMYDEKLEEIQSVGTMFDPQFHEAVGMKEVEADREGIVVEEWQKGYCFNGKLLRPSRVSVGKTSESKPV